MANRCMTVTESVKCGILDLSVDVSSRACRNVSVLLNTWSRGGLGVCRFSVHIISVHLIPFNSFPFNLTCTGQTLGFKPLQRSIRGLSAGPRCLAWEGHTHGQMLIVEDSTK